MALTEEQRAVVEWRGGHVLVEAVAGSGKTTVLVERNAWLLDEGETPSALLSLVYNKDAQLTFEARLKPRVEGAVPRVRTFHALAYQMLGKLVQRGVVPEFTLLTKEAEIRKLMGEALKRAMGTSRGWDQELLDDFAGFVTVVKSGFESAGSVWRDKRYGKDTAAFVGAFEVFEEQRKARGVLTFDDMILDAVTAIGDDGDLWALFNEGLRHLIVDETQDINEVQFALMQGLTSRGAKLMAVGDSGQAIYGFRGASPAFILHRIPMTYGCPRLTLSRTFRYGHRTALMASHGLDKNTQKGSAISIAAPGTPKTDVVFVKRLETHGVEMLKEAFKDGGNPNVAILGRRFSDLVGMEIGLLAAGVPYFVLGKSTRGMQREVAGLMGVLGWLRSAWGGFDMARRKQMTGSIWRYPTAYLTKPVLEELDAVAATAKDGRDLLRLLRNMVTALKRSDPRAAGRLGDRVAALEAVWDLPPSIEPAVLLRIYAARAKLADTMRSSATNPERGEDAVSGMNAVLEVIDGVASAEEVMALMRKLEEQDAKAPDGPAVILTSIHRSKGLEYDTVMLASVGEMSDPTMLEEERRLTYVAVTRARQQLWVEAPWLAEGDIRVNEILPPPAPRRMPRWLEEAEVVKSLAVTEALLTGEAIPSSGDVVRRYVEATRADAERLC